MFFKDFRCSKIKRRDTTQVNNTIMVTQVYCIKQYEQFKFFNIIVPLINGFELDNYYHKFTFSFHVKI